MISCLGRTPVSTRIVPEGKRADLPLHGGENTAAEQSYLVYPLGRERADRGQDALKMYEQLRRGR